MKRRLFILIPFLAALHGCGAPTPEDIQVAGQLREGLTTPESWSNNDLTALAGGPGARTDWGLSGYSGSDGSQHVNYVGREAHIHEMYLPPGGHWVDNDLTALTGGPPASFGKVHGYWGSDGSQHVDYRSWTNHHIHELFNSTGGFVSTGGRWVDEDLTAMAGGVGAAWEGGLASYWGSDGSQHVIYIDDNGSNPHIRELFLSSGGHWVSNDLTALTGATPLSNGTMALDGYWAQDGSQHIHYFGNWAHIHELLRPSGGNWGDSDLRNPLI